jgi:hypothetical protein
MKISIESYGKKYIVETDNEDVGIDEYADHFFGLLTLVGFHKDTILDGLKAFIEEI